MSTGVRRRTISHGIVCPSVQHERLTSLTKPWPNPCSCPVSSGPLTCPLTASSNAVLLLLVASSHLSSSRQRIEAPDIDVPHWVNSQGFSRRPQFIGLAHCCCSGTNTGSAPLCEVQVPPSLRTRALGSPLIGSSPPARRPGRDRR